jgi:hypothetical protein
MDVRRIAVSPQSFPIFIAGLVPKGLLAREKHMWWETNDLCPVSGQRPSFQGGCQSEYWTYADDSDQAETALQAIAALQSITLMAPQGSLALGFAASLSHWELQRRFQIGPQGRREVDRWWTACSVDEATCHRSDDFLDSPARNGCESDAPSL